MWSSVTSALHDVLVIDGGNPIETADTSVLLLFQFALFIILFNKAQSPREVMCGFECCCWLTKSKPSRKKKHLYPLKVTLRRYHDDDQLPSQKLCLAGMVWFRRRGVCLGMKTCVPFPPESAGDRRWYMLSPERSLIPSSPLTGRHKHRPPSLSTPSVNQE